MSASRHLRLPVVFVFAVVIASCSSDQQGPIFSGPATLVNISVLVHNSTGAEFTVICDCTAIGNKTTIAQDSSVRIRVIADTNPERPYFFDVARRDVALARVSYRVLKFPERIKDKLVSQEVKIVVTQPSPGIFSAATVDTLWIEVLGTTPLLSPGT